MLEDDDLLLGLVAHLDILKSPCKAVLYGTTFEKSILVAVNNFENDFLQSISQ